MKFSTAWWRKASRRWCRRRPKLFSAVEPSLAIPGYLARKRQTLEQELTDNGRAGSA